MRSHIIDSNYHGHLFSTEASRAIFCDDSRMQRWLDVEAALARSQAEVGLIPAAAAEEICNAAALEKLDTKRIQADIRQTGHSLVGLLHALRDRCANDHGQYVHYGVTTQDIQDTGQALEMRLVLIEVTAGLETILERLQGLARKYQFQLQVGRTHAQPALPITFGLKVASWLDELGRNLDRLKECASRALVIELFGACGTMSEMGPRAFDVLELTAQRLQLYVPRMAWHASRDRVVEFGFVLCLIVATLSRLADEYRELSRPEFDEIELPWEESAIASSTLPQKRNPEDCEQIVVLARLSKGLLVASLDGLSQDHERDFRGTRVEWVTFVDSAHYVLKAIELTSVVLSSHHVNHAAMTANALRQQHLIGMERVAFALAPSLGKDQAMLIVREACRQASLLSLPVTDVLAANERVSETLSARALNTLLNPHDNVGMAGQIVDRVLRTSSVKAGESE